VQSTSTEQARRDARKAKERRKTWHLSPELTQGEATPADMALIEASYAFQGEYDNG
jgi:hypothetical protein